MIVEETPIPGLKILNPVVHGDERGYFMESYNLRTMRELGISDDFVQDNESRSVYGVIRGLHYQLAPYDQAKLVRVVVGRVYDVAVDLREGSPTFGQWFGLELSDENKKQFLIPRGFAHGFSVLSPEVVFAYKADNYYNGTAERGIAFNDPALGIDWGIPERDIILSGKDKLHPGLDKAEMNFKWK